MRPLDFKVLVCLRSSLFCDITQRWVEVLYRRFGTTYGSHLQGSRSPTFWDNLWVPSSRVKKSNFSGQPMGPIFKDQDVLNTSWSFKMGPIGCPETLVQNYHSTLRNIAEERRSNLQRAGSLISRCVSCCRCCAHLLWGCQWLMAPSTAICNLWVMYSFSDRLWFMGHLFILRRCYLFFI
jgi:hypothetical protein